MNSETRGENTDVSSQTIQVELPKTHHCPQCGSLSDGLANCLHVNTTVGAEIRCLTCYRAYVQSEDHLKNIQAHIPIMVRLPQNEKVEEAKA